MAQVIYFARAVLKLNFGSVASHRLATLSLNILRIVSTIDSNFETYLVGFKVWTGKLNKSA